MGDAYPTVVPAVDIPLHQVAIPLGKVGLEAVGLGDLGAFLVTGLFVGLVVAVLGVKLFTTLGMWWWMDGCGSGARHTRFANLPIWCLGHGQYSARERLPGCLLLVIELDPGLAQRLVLPQLLLEPAEGHLDLAAQSAVGPLWGRCRHGRHTEHPVTDCCAGRSGIGCLGASRARESLETTGSSTQEVARRWRSHDTRTHTSDELQVSRARETRGVIDDEKLIKDGCGR